MLDLMKIRKLPDVVIDGIYEYIPYHILVFLTKENYLKYHSVIKDKIPSNNYENYIRYMIRQDNDFVFKHILNENGQKWRKIKKYYYQYCIYLNYLYFIDAYCIDNESRKCRNVLLCFMEEHDLNKNKHKKKITTNVRWR